MKKLLLAFLLTLAVNAASPERADVLHEAKANARRLAEFQKLSAKAFSAAKSRDALMAEWVAACAKERGVPREDGGCQEKPPAQAQPQRPTPRPPATPPPSTEVPK